MSTLMLSAAQTAFSLKTFEGCYLFSCWCHHHQVTWPGQLESCVPALLMLACVLKTKYGMNLTLKFTLRWAVF